RVDTVLRQNLLAILDVAMPANGDVVIARIVNERIALGVDRDADRARPRPQRVQICRRIKMVVKINDRQRGPFLSPRSGAPKDNRPANPLPPAAGRWRYLPGSPRPGWRPPRPTTR